MFTRIKTPEEINNLRQSGKILEEILLQTKDFIKVGMSTMDVANYSARLLSGYKNTKPVFLGYFGFPHVICISVNDEVIHGIPSDSNVISVGDVVSLDFGVNYKGMITDSARTFVVGKTNSQKQLLIEKTKQALDEGISVVKDSIRVGDISSKIEQTLSNAELGIVREYVGHGVGHELHEEPNIPNYGMAGRGELLRSGMTIAIEPMAILGPPEVYTESDGWTVVSKSHLLSAHFEDTVLITDGGFEILTRTIE